MVLEVTPNNVRTLLQFVHTRDLGLFEFIVRAKRRQRMNAGFQVAVQVFIWIQLWRIGREIKHFDFVGMFLQPGPNDFRVMNPQIIEDQKHFPLRILEKPLHELDQGVGRSTAFSAS